MFNALGKNNILLTQNLDVVSRTIQKKLATNIIILIIIKVMYLLAMQVLYRWILSHE